MPRPRQISDERILEVTCELCLEHGPTISTSTIAERLGISQAVLFQRFSTKEQLLRAALTPKCATWVPRAEAGPDERPIRDQLAELAQAVAEFFDDLTPRLALLRAMGIDDVFPPGEPPPLRAHRALEGWLERAAASGRARPCNATYLAWVFLGSLQIRPWFTHVFGQKRPPAERPAYVATIVDLLWNALRPDEP